MSSPDMPIQAHLNADTLAEALCQSKQCALPPGSLVYACADKRRDRGHKERVFEQIIDAVSGYFLLLLMVLAGCSVQGWKSDM